MISGKEWKPELPKKAVRLSRQEKKIQTRSKLIDSAHTLFALKGYEGCTIDDIASAAGFSRGAFYAHFGSKEAIMEALIDHGFDKDIEAMGPMEGVSDNLVELTKAYQEYGDRFAADPSNLLWSMEFQLASLRHTELRPAYREQYRRLSNSVGDMIEKVMSSEDRADARTLRRFAPIFIILQASLGLQSLVDPEGTPHTLLGETFELLLKGMMAE